MALVEKELVSTTGNVWKDHVLVHTGETDRQTYRHTHTDTHSLHTLSQLFWFQARENHSTQRLVPGLLTSLAGKRERLFLVLQLDQIFIYSLFQYILYLPFIYLHDTLKMVHQNFRISKLKGVILCHQV